MKQSTWLILAAVGAGAALWHLSRKRALPAPYVPAPGPTPGPRPVCSGAFRYGWWSPDGGMDVCWDFCEKKRVDDAVCELA